MFRNSHNSKGLSTNAVRWRSVFIALALALVIGSVGQTHPAHAAPAHEVITWYMDVINPKTTICVGETVEYRVKAFFVNTVEPRSEWALSGVKIEATSSNKSAGNFKKDTAITGFANEDLVTAGFSFTAKKPGKTNLYFEGLVDKKFTSTYVSFTVPVKVIPCKFKVKTVLQFPVPDLYNITVISDEAVMTADEAGAFTGSATMSWVYSEVFQDCDFSISATDSQVDLTGQLDDNGGQFVATETFQPTTVTDTACCPVVGCVSYSAQGSLYPLTFKVASSGGVAIQTVTGEGVSGLAHIVVIPEEDEVVAFNTDNRAALSPSAWWTMLWDDFPWAYSVLLVLR